MENVQKWTGNRVKTLRNAKGWSQPLAFARDCSHRWLAQNAHQCSQLKLSTESGLDPSWIGQDIPMATAGPRDKFRPLRQETAASLHLERGVVVPTIKTLDQICKGLDISLAEFFNPTQLKAREDDFLVQEILSVSRSKPTKTKRLIRDFAHALR